MTCTNIKIIKRASTCILIATVLTSLTVGCSSSRKTAMMSKHMGPDKADVQLSEAAMSVSHSLHTMAETEQGASKQPILTPPDPASYGMGNKATVDWSGPVEPLLKKIVKASHYKLKVLGTRPAVPIVVTVINRDTPVGDILRNIGYQSGKRAKIVVFPSTRTVELRYSKA